jgi:DNA-binding protein HU-beta
VNKGELVEEIAAKTKMAPSDVAAVVNAFIATVSKTVAGGEKVVLSGFGTFDRRARGPRVARDIWAGKPLRVRATSVPSFKAGKPFKEAVSRRRRVAVPPKRAARGTARRPRA